MTGLIYVASPYSHAFPEIVNARIKIFVQFMAEIIQLGKHPVSPLMNHFLSDTVPIDFPLTWEYWENYSKLLLSKCDKLFVIATYGWENSSGVTAEIALAKELNIPIVMFDHYEQLEAHFKK